MDGPIVWHSMRTTVVYSVPPVDTLPLTNNYRQQFWFFHNYSMVDTRQ